MMCPVFGRSKIKLPLLSINFLSVAGIAFVEQEPAGDKYSREPSYCEIRL